MYSVEQSQTQVQDGGKRKKVTKTAPRKSTTASKTSPKASPKKVVRTRKSTASKKGGSLVNDVKNLAVPFAILLAKEGLSKVFKKDKEASPKKSAKTSRSAKTTSAKSAKKPTSVRRRTMSGGSCNLGCAAQTGGAVKELFKLQQEIDQFLEKY